MPGSNPAVNKRASPSTTRRLKLPNSTPAAGGDASDPQRPKPTTPTTPTTAAAAYKIPSRHGRAKSLDAWPGGHARDAMAGHLTSGFPTNPAVEPPPKPWKADTDLATDVQPLPVVRDASAAAAAIGLVDNGAAVADENTSPVATLSQRQLHDYRERLARDLERRELTARGLLLNSNEKTRVSPIPEEAMSYQLTAPGPTTTSTESGNTVRGGMTPATIANTPSYPFPRMAGAAFTSSNLYRSFSAFSPTSSPLNTHTMSFEPYRGVQDKVLSNSSTPASTFNFNPSNMTPRRDVCDFPDPNLYDLSLMLSAEPGLDAWWNTVVQIMKDVYKAERVTLAVPADTTDIENVPWGQKATYNGHQEDDLSLGYMAGGSSQMRSSDIDSFESPFPDETSRLATPQRPNITSRHSFTSFEDGKGKGEDVPSTGANRPSYLARSKSYFPPAQQNLDQPDEYRLNKATLHNHDLLEDQSIPSWEEPLLARQPGQGRVLPVLQALNYEADPLIDHTGVMRVLDRGRVVALTRTYPYLETNIAAEAANNTQKQSTKSTSSDANKRPKKQRSEPSSSKLTSFLGGSLTSRGSLRGKASAGDKGKGPREEDEPPRPPTPKYEEYEQTPPSPWSQSPAPSPAVRSDPAENPFFTDATVDEESFNPDSGFADYASMRPPEAIGVDNSWTVLHIPLSHVLSKPTRTFKLNSAAIDQRSQGRNHGSPGASTRNENQNIDASGRESPNKSTAPPIAILSILSPIIPYPSNLRHSLEHLAPHMATSFSLCRHYSHLETELAGFRRRRPSTAGFGAVAPDGRPLASAAFLAGAEVGRQHSMGGSITSPSDYSAVSKSMTGSPLGTPGWEQGGLGFISDKRAAVSPAAIAHGSESYFSSKQRSASMRHEALSSGSQSRPASKDNSAEKRSSRLSTTQMAQNATPADDVIDRASAGQDEASAISSKRSSLKENREAGFLVPEEQTAENATDRQAEASKQDHSHTLLHSYGADFATTFQSLPPSSSLNKPHLPTSATSRTMSYSSAAADMPPPSDRLKGLMLDSIPAHVFVALPQTGEVVWVNSRYLSYRGQTVADLAEDPWSSFHPDDCDEYLREWGHSLRTGEQFSRTVRIRRFDGQYRWFHARAVASKDKRGVIMQFLGSYMDIHDQHTAELKAARQEEIEASEAKHRLLANLIPQIIFTATEEDGITFANEQWLSYAGQSFGDSLGLGFLDYVHPEDLARCRIPTDQPPTPMGNKRAPVKKMSDSNLRGVHKALSRTNSSENSSVYELPTADLTELAKKGIIKVTTDSDGRVSYTTEVRLRSKNGEYRWHLIRCVQIDTIDFGSGASSYFGSATDINDHKLLEAKLKEAMEAKGRFLSNMSHEIRTPLIGISGMVSFLQDTTLNEEQRDYTNTIQTSANSLIMIINDILDLSKVDAGMMKLKYEWFHTRALIEDVNELVSTMAIAKGLELNYLVEADVPAWVKGDKVRIRQVLLNVIGNAIKFTSSGEVFSRCKVLVDEHPEDNENTIMLEYAITDTGLGFTKEEAELIFKPFSQIDGSSTRQHGGSGLGLVISKQLVELHGGTMGGTAEPGKGSTFVFSARFSLPTPDDRPNFLGSPAFSNSGSARQQPEAVPDTMKQLPPPKQPRAVEETSASGAYHDFSSPGVTSNGSSNQSIHSSRTHLTDQSSATSVNTGLARFSEAAKASGQDLSQMTLQMPSGRSSPGRTATPGIHGHPTTSAEDFRPPMYSILIICPQFHSREATTQHIEMTLPKDVPHQITALASAAEAHGLIGGDDPINFTHIVINLGSAEAVIDLMEQVMRTQKMETTTILILSDSVQRQAVMKYAGTATYEKLFSDNQVTFIYKPVKPSRFAVIFDPEKQRDLSTDRNRSTAQQMVENQKASYQEIEKRMGNKGYKVLLVEDNPVNQKVLMKYLKKIGVEVEVAVDGTECTDMVISRPHEYYSLILCDLHMPRKDGYQACREIRQWEKSSDFPKMPIIALSANVMSDVQDKCVAAGFSDYVTKPVDFIDLSRAMANFF